jgi:hypothetical protein
MRQRRAVASRASITREGFIAELAAEPVEEEAAALLWDKLVEIVIVPGLSPWPDDEFLWLYGLAEEDLDEDIVVDIFQRLGIDLPTSDVVQRVGAITTPRHFIQLVQLSYHRRNPDQTK